MFNWKKPTAQMLGRWQPWHQGHQELFKRIHKLTGQVCIMVRDVPIDSDANPLLTNNKFEDTSPQNDNPFSFDTVKENIVDALDKDNYNLNVDYIIMQVPNIVDISYGRGVGYTFTEHDLGKEVHDISATKIRQQLRDEGKL